jgi:hypothetical protein
MQSPPARTKHQKIFVQLNSNKKRERIIILSLFILTLTGIVAVALIFEFLAQHLSPFLELPLPCRTTFAFVISPFTAGGFPAFESLCHIDVKLRLALSYQHSYSIASNFLQFKKVSPIVIPNGLPSEIAVKLPNRYILDLPEDLDIQRLEKR